MSEYKSPILWRDVRRRSWYAEGESFDPGRETEWICHPGLLSWFKARGLKRIRVVACNYADSLHCVEFERLFSDSVNLIRLDGFSELEGLHTNFAEFLNESARRGFSAFWIEVIE